MSARLSLVLALAMLAAPLAGCLGSDEDPVQAQNATDDATDAVVGNPADTYIANPDGNVTELDPTDVLAEDVPVPTGIDRHIEHEKERVFEPTIGVTSEGTLFISNWGGSMGTGWSSVLRSTDQGETWEDVTGSIGPVSSPPQSNDPYVYVDEATDRVYNLDMQGLQGNWIRWSDDEGDTWTTRPQAGETPVLDHPTIFSGPPSTLETVGYENVVYLCVNRVADSACATSLDGGLTWSPFRTVFPGMAQGVMSSAEGSCGGLHAHGTTGPDGTAYLPKGHCNIPSVAVSEDDGLTWDIREITTEVGIVGHELALATDDQGNLFAHWDNNHRPTFAVSTDKGQTWSEPIDVAPPELSMMEFPTIAATGNGSVALAYVGTTDDIEDRQEADENTTWNGYMTTILDATEEDPAMMTTTANDPDDPIARGPCHLGNRCYGPQGGALGDFIDITIDDEGRPWAAFVDVCTQECVDNASVGKDVGVGFVGTLNEGPSLQDPTEALPPLVTAETDASPSE